jgi:hypothetical protein
MTVDFPAPNIPVTSRASRVVVTDDEPTTRRTGARENE